ncbi:NAD(P)-dependent dehydrogenase (short-subunit alcohol dehydrogenase family) [Marmoricola sp. URHA0025 HA25]
MGHAQAALITGGSAGIGLAMAARLAGRGWHVTICGRNQEKLDKAHAELDSIGNGRIHTVAANLAMAGAAVAVMAEHREVAGRLDMLVNNAGRGAVATVEGVTDKHLDLEWELNVKSAFTLIREGLGMLRSAADEHGRSHVVNVSSLASRESPAKAAVYAATKAALNSLSQTSHAALSRDGIHVCAVLPGLVDTPGASWAGESVRSVMMTADDVAATLDFLLALSPRCFVPEIMLTGAGDNVFSTAVDWSTTEGVLS